ncbi:MAG: glutaredoxin family protein [Clostridia bacterium]
MREMSRGTAEVAVPPVAVYCHTHCLGGEEAIAWLRSAQIPFRVYDIGRDANARAAWRALGAHPSPVLVVNGQVLVGFDRVEVARLLGRAPA